VGGRGNADRWGHGVNGSRKNKRKSGQVGRCGREKMGRHAGWAERKVRFLFLFLKKTQIKPNFKLKFIQNLFKLFHKIF
jgi:hypothetical protein